MAVPKRKKVTGGKCISVSFSSYRLCIRCEGIIRSGAKACMSCRGGLRLG